MRVFVSVTTEDGELLERFELQVSSEPLYPLGRQWTHEVLGPLESAARTVRARAESEGAA